MKDQFIPYHLALKLKQFGFNQPCIGYYNEETEELFPYQTTIPTNGHKCAAPLWQQAFDWFRIEHKLLSSISQPFNQEYCFEIKNLKDEKKEGELSSMQSKVFTLYSDAKYQCLERLIQEIQSNLPF